MQERTPFVRKLLRHIDRLDRETVENYVYSFAADNELFREILQQLTEGIILVNREGKIQFFNRQASAWFNLRTEMIGKTEIEEVLEDGPLKTFVQSHLKSLRQKTVEDFSLLSPREISLRVYLIPAQSAPAKSVILVFSDITHQKIRDMETTRIARIEGLLRLAAGLAHEIGNPLNSLAIHLALLKNVADDLPLKKRDLFSKTLSVLNAETGRLDGIVRNFLKVTRRPPLRFKLEDLNLLLEEAIDVMKPSLQEKKIRIRFSPDSSLPPFLLDRERLHQAFLNLIKNSIEAMPDGGEINLKTVRKENLAIVKFQDTGQGIVEEDLPHIFEAYFTTKEEGSGLGLMIVYNAIADHAARIEVESKPGKGTSFTLLFPIRRTKLQLPFSSKPLKG